MNKSGAIAGVKVETIQLVKDKLVEFKKQSGGDAQKFMDLTWEYFKPDKRVA